MDAQSFDILRQLLLLNDFQVDKEELQLQLLSHPSFPSLYSLAEVLQHFGIDHVAVSLPTTTNTLEQLPDSFIANIKINDKDQLVLVTQHKKHIKLSYSSSKTTKLTIDQFLNSWTGVLLAIEKNKPESSNKRLSYEHSIIAILYFLVIALIGGTVWMQASVYTGLYFSSSIIGLLFSIIIIKHELGWQSPNVSKFCQISGGTNCSAVIRSKGAKLFGWIKLSDLSLIFFSALSLSWIVAFIAKIPFWHIAVFTTIASIPILIYSLYYQYRVARKWCPLCLTIAGVLILQLALVSTQLQLFTFPEKGIEGWGLLLAIILINVIGWNFLKPLLVKQQQLQKLRIEQHTFKRNFQVFNALYQQTSILPENTNIEGDIILGNPHAPLKLLLVTNPACYYCKEAHQDIEQLLEKNKDRISITIRFNVSKKAHHHLAYQVASILLSVYQAEGIAACRELLHEVYQEKVELKQW
ncbi:MAG: thioredoxin domain-containing protein, partial [Chitinophagales bacterium]|nr:thioredoxin domain-containing protein [Chitinophagales bacterium]